MKKVMLHLGFLFIISGISILLIDNVSASINNYYDDIEKTKEIVASVNKEYSDFKQKSIDVKVDIVDVSKKLNIFYDKFDSENIEIKNVINKIENEIKEITTITENLKEYCDYKINNQLIKNKCESYKSNYKNMFVIIKKYYIYYK